MATEPEHPLRNARALYGKSLDEGSMKALHALLEQAAEGETDSVRAERLALKAVVSLCNHLNRWNGADRTIVEEAEKAIEAALKIHPDLAQAHYASGFIHRTKGDHQAALGAFTKATELAPGYARAHAQKGAELLYLGFPEKAVPEVQKARELTHEGDPLHAMCDWIIGRALFFEGKYQDAIPFLQEFTRKLPHAPYYGPAYLVSAHALVGDRESARRELQKFNDRFPGYTVARIIENEATNPNHHPLVVEGRRRFHEGLAKAGMPLTPSPG